MAYNLYQAQMAKAWAQRVEKEQQLAERFWAKHATRLQQEEAAFPFHSGSGMGVLPAGNLKDVETCSSIAPTYVSDLTSETTSTEFLKSRLAVLEKELMREREKRLEIEQILDKLQASAQKS